MRVRVYSIPIRCSTHGKSQPTMGQGRTSKGFNMKEKLILTFRRAFLFVIWKKPRARPFFFFFRNDA